MKVYFILGVFRGHGITLGRYAVIRVLELLGLFQNECVGPGIKPSAFFEDPRKNGFGVARPASLFGGKSSLVILSCRKYQYQRHSRAGKELGFIKGEDILEE
ncbi:unnamed protein product [Parascedosporium putredinis]|uniref:Uncharacterized protein n=1 Tax=Parascedosporium putredinis TaxID=1442378 RepID=A0A9P1M8K2_9PEZI|nr:unnamed protein product [Parascedosporium putredinis]CAI7989061.1 unnamed protein product [Parascedosporium putredinis]